MSKDPRQTLIRVHSSKNTSGNSFLPLWRWCHEINAVLRRVHPEYRPFSTKVIQHLHEEVPDSLLQVNIKNPMPSCRKSSLIWDCVWCFEQGSLKRTLVRLPTHQLGLSHLSLLSYLDKMTLWSFGVLMNQSPPSVDPRETFSPSLSLDCRAV